MESGFTGRIPFVGRRWELARLRARLEAATGGQGGIVLLAGEPGIGKTRLAEELVTEAPRWGGRVLWGRCYEGEGAPAFWPWIQILRAYVRDVEPLTLRDEMGAGAPDVAELVLEVRERLPDILQAPPLEPEQARFRLFESVTAFLQRASRRRPLVLVLDDLHWADRASLLLLQFLARELDSFPLLVVGAYREAEVGRGDPLAHTLADLVRCGGCDRLVMGGLSEPDVARVIELVAGAAPNPALAATVYGTTEGNPLFVSELARLLAHDAPPALPDRSQPPPVVIPQTVRDVILRRLDRLPAPSQQVLAVAAVVGRDFSVHILRLVDEVAITPLLEALEVAESARVIVASPSAPGEYRFSHALIRETLYEGLPAARRAQLHGRVGEALERGAGALVEPHLDKLAHHFFQAAPAGGAGKAAGYARRAGDRALAIYAYEEAAYLYTMALQVLDLADPEADGSAAEQEAERCDLLLALGEALLPAGELGRAADEVAPAALTVAESLGDHGRAARACRLALDALHRFGETPMAATPEGRLWAERADQFAAPGTAERVHADIDLARVHSMREEWAQTWSLLDRALTLARGLADPESEFRAAMEIIMYPWPMHYLERRRCLVEEFIGRSRAGVSPRTLGILLWRSGLQNLGWGERDRAEALWREVQELAERTRDGELLLLPLIADSVLAMLDGRLEESLALSARAVVRSAAVGAAAFGRQWTFPMTGRCLHYLGRVSEALTLVDTGDHTGQLDAFWTAPVRAIDLAHLGRQEESREVLRGYLGRRDMDRLDENTSAAMLLLTLQTAVLIEDRESVATLARWLAPLAGLAAIDWDLRCVARVLGEAAVLLGDGDAARRYFAQALEAAGRIRSRPELALTHLDLAELLFTHFPRDYAEARAHLETALVEVGEMGMQPSLTRALDLQRRQAAGPARVRRPAYPDGLTPREAEVLRLIARGRSNREIADELVLSLRTVERHITNIYDKIGARARADATTYAIGHALVPSPVPAQ